MSVETIEDIRRAVEAHVADLRKNRVGDNQVVTHWFVGYETMQHDPNADEGLSHAVGYTTSPSSPSAVTGCAELALAHMKTDLTQGNWGTDEEEYADG